MTVGEQAPKMWALRRAETVSMATAFPLRAFAALFRPFIWFVNAISKGLLKAMGFPEPVIHDEARDALELPPYRVTVLSMSRRRVERLRFEILPEQPEPSSPDFGPAVT